MRVNRLIMRVNRLKRNMSISIMGQMRKSLMSGRNMISTIPTRFVSLDTWLCVVVTYDYGEL